MERFDLQKEFLTNLMNKEFSVKVIMSNGFQLTGRIVGFDQFTIFLDMDGKKNLLYKSNISTIREEG